MNLPFILIAGTLGMLLLAGSIILFTVIYQKRMALHRLHLKEVDLSHQMELLHSTIEVQEAERKRLSGDLHDEVGALLATLRLTLSQLPLQEKEKQKELLAESKRLVDAISSSARRISHALTPPGLEIFGLPATLNALLAPLETLGLEILFETNLEEGRPDQRSALAIYRVTQELISNSLKHSGATKISLRIDQEKSSYVMTYSDNGQGFNTGKPHGNGIGLKNIESRISQVQGKIEFPPAEQGMLIQIEIPENHGKN